MPFPENGERRTENGERRRPGWCDGRGGGRLGGGGLIGEDVWGGGVVGAGVGAGGFDGVGVEDDDFGDAGGGVAVLDDDAVVALVAEFLGADGAGVSGGAGGESGVGGGAVGGVFEGDEDGIGVPAVTGGVALVGGEVGALDVHGGAAAGGVEDADAGGGGVVPEDAGFAVLVEEFGVDGLGVVFPVAEETFEVGGADVDPELFGELGALAVGGLEPGVAAPVEVSDGVALGLRGVGELGVFDAGVLRRGNRRFRRLGPIRGRLPPAGTARMFRRYRRCRRFRSALTGDWRGRLGGCGVRGEGAEEAALGVFEGEGGAFGEEGLDGLDDGLVLLVGAGVVGGEGEDGSAVLDAIGDPLVLGEDLPDALNLRVLVVGPDAVLDGRRGLVGGGEGDGGRELGLDGVEDFGGVGGGFAGEAGDGGDAVGEGNGDAFAHGEAADVVGVDGLEAVVGDIGDTVCEGLNVGEDVACQFVAGIGGAVEALGLGILDVAELVVEQVVGERGRAIVSGEIMRRRVEG